MEELYDIIISYAGVYTVVFVFMFLSFLDIFDTSIELTRAPLDVG